MPRLSIAAARRIRATTSSICCRSVPLFIDDDGAQTNFRYTSMKNNFSSPPSLLKKREYHSTSRKEILPFIAVGLLGATAVYTFRALQQMDKDWDDYYDALEEYKSATGLDPEKDSSAAASTNPSNQTSSHNLSSHFTGGTLAIDLGTSTLKLSHRQSSSQTNNKKIDPTVIVDREGYRSTPALVWVGENNNEDMIVGRMAQARSFDKKGHLIHPRLAMEKNDNNELALKATREIIHTAASNALDQILGGGREVGYSDEPLFVLDSTLAMNGSQRNVRPIFLYPPSHDESQFLDCYRNATNELTSPAGIASFVAEPVAAITGAEYYNLLPPEVADAGSVLVVDVGGQSTSISMVSGDKEVLHSSSFPFGGDTFVDALVSHLIRNFEGFQHEEMGGMGRDDTSPLSSRPSLSDTSALQRLYEASTQATHELSKKSRSEINVPYLTMDLETRQPRHLEVGVARAVVESEVETFIRNFLVPHLGNDGMMANCLRGLLVL